MALHLLQEVYKMPKGIGYGKKKKIKRKK